MSTKSTTLWVPTPTSPRSPPSRSTHPAEPPKNPYDTTHPSIWPVAVVYDHEWLAIAPRIWPW